MEKLFGAMKLHQEPETIQIATLLTVIGAEARKVLSMFTFGEGDRDRIQPVLESFAAYCQPTRPTASQILRLRVDVSLWDRARLLVCFSSLFIKGKV